MEQKQEGIQLRDYIQVIWKKKWLIAVPTLFLTLGAGVISCLMPPVYKIDALLKPSQIIFLSSSGEIRETPLTSTKQITEMLEQGIYAQGISSELGLEPSQISNIQAQTLGNTNLIRVSLKHKNKDLGRDILNLLFTQIKKDMDQRIEMELKNIDTKIVEKKRQIQEKRIDIEIQQIEKNKLQDTINSDQNKLILSEKREKAILEDMLQVEKSIEELESLKKKLLSLKSSPENTESLFLYSSQMKNSLQVHNDLKSMLKEERIYQEDLNLEIKHCKQQLKLKDNEIEKLENKILEIEEQIKLAEEEKQRIVPAEWVKPPSSSSQPVAPNKKLNVAVTGIISLFLFTTLAFFLAHMEENKSKKR